MKIGVLKAPTGGIFNKIIFLFVINGKNVKTWSSFCQVFYYIKRSSVEAFLKHQANSSSKDFFLSNDMDVMDDGNFEFLCFPRTRVQKFSPLLGLRPACSSCLLLLLLTCVSLSAFSVERQHKTYMTDYWVVPCEWDTIC